MIRIAKAKVSESQEVRLLEKRVWREEVTNKYDIPMLVRFGYAYVAKDNGTIIGAILGFAAQNQEVYICDLVIDPNYRRMGVGEKLYKKFLARTKGRNIVSFIDPDNTASIALNLKLGAKIVRKIKNPYDLGRGYQLFVRLKN